ncbi:MAG: MBL fold metallo-hydrolase [Oscillospiraceae bacterium]|jgi:competence protein ComEC|nr:MBL fold metallo-hydrolase [Oscillospiraceae bacterium]
MAGGRKRRSRVFGVVFLLAALVAGFCILSSMEELEGYDFGLPDIGAPSFTDVFGEVEDISREAGGDTSLEHTVGTVSGEEGAILEFHLIDVGQAQSILIIGPEKTVLIDGGENNQGDEVLRYLRDQGVSSVDLLIGTHPHSDHIGGLDDIIASLAVEEVTLPPIPGDITPTTDTYTDLLTAILERDIPFVTAAPGDRYELGEGAYLAVLAPAGEYDDLNNISIVCRAVYGDTSFLITSDIERKAESDILEAGEALRSDVLVVAHHGSDTSSSEEFLRAVSPRVALISCGADNSYGHPHREVMERLESMDLLIRRTDLDGTVLLVSDGENIRIETENAG